MGSKVKKAVDTGAATKEDAATAAAREELKQTVISEEGGDRAAAGEENDSVISPAADADSNDESAEGDGDVATVKEGLSPKKKRAHDQVDKDKYEESDGHSDSSAGSRDRATRQEPEKKRARDDGSQKPDDKTSTAKETSPSAFASSGFAKLSSSTSPFGSLGGAVKPSVFGGAPVLSPPAATTPASSFSSAAASTSAFGGLGAAKSNGFGGGGGFAGGSGAGSAFGGGSSGFGGLTGFGTLSKPGGLSTFAKPGAELKSGKPAKPFGAPESDNDDDDDDDDDDESGGDSGSDDESNDKTEKDRDDEKRKPRLQKVNVDDGETGEATILAVRAKLFYLNKDSGGWKERGAGMLKINVPGGSIEFDNEGATVPGSFDASVVEGDRRPRLILRQDQTHRVLLNTAIQPEAEFIEKTTLRATHVIFTALEGDDAKPVSITAKMSAASAKLFLAELDSVQQALREQ